MRTTENNNEGIAFKFTRLILLKAIATNVGKLLPLGFNSLTRKSD